MTRDERAITPQALGLFRYHWQIGFDRGLIDGQIVGFFKGVATTLIVLAILTVIL